MNALENLRALPELDPADIDARHNALPLALGSISLAGSDELATLISDIPDELQKVFGPFDTPIGSLGDILPGEDSVLELLSSTYPNTHRDKPGEPRLSPPLQEALQKPVNQFRELLQQNDRVRLPRPAAATVELRINPRYQLYGPSPDDYNGIPKLHEDGDWATISGAIAGPGTETFTVDIPLSGGEPDWEFLYRQDQEELRRRIHQPSTGEIELFTGKTIHRKAILGGPLVVPRAIMLVQIYDYVPIHSKRWAFSEPALDPTS